MIKLSSKRTRMFSILSHACSLHDTFEKPKCHMMVHTMSCLPYSGFSRADGIGQAVTLIPKSLGGC